VLKVIFRKLSYQKVMLQIVVFAKNETINDKLQNNSRKFRVEIIAYLSYKKGLTSILNRPALC
jgi:hypothetical protein